MILAEIVKCQCVSIATCEMAYYVQNTIKQKICNRMSTSNLESMMRVAKEGPDNDFDDILTSALDQRGIKNSDYNSDYRVKYLANGLTFMLEPCTGIIFSFSFLYALDLWKDAAKFRYLYSNP